MRKEKEEKIHFNSAKENNGTKEKNEERNNDEKTISIIDWADKLQIYQTAMDHEQNMRTSYQNLLTTLEVALFVTFLTLYQVDLAHWVFPAIGIFLCFPFGIACEFRARNVDIWRIHIVELVKETDVWGAFKESKYRWIPFGKVGFWGEFLFGHWFERILITGMLIGWSVLLWYFPNPFIIRLCSVLAILVWIIYAFRIIELKGEIIPYLYRR